MNWIDVNDNDVLAVAIINQWKQSRVAHVTTIPIMLSIDFNSLEHVRQTNRGKDAVNGDVFVFEDVNLTRPHVGCRQEQLDLAIRLASCIEIDAGDEHVTYRVVIQGIEL